jgi:WS/DGAT/MGAT family acyltransferase
MDLSRPLWEYHLISGLAGRRFAIYTKLHHAMFDGAAGMRLMNFSTDPATSFGPPFWADPSRRREEPEARPSPLLEWLPALVEDEVKSLPSLVRGLAAAAGAAIGVGTPPDLTSVAEAPRMLFNVRVGAQRRVATYDVRLARLQAVGNVTGATVNEVLLAVCSGALRRYLLERDALPVESLISAVPMALHHEEGASAGNAVTCLNARLGTDIEDVRQRFETICRTSAAGKAQLRGMTRTAAMHFATLLSVPLLVSWLPGMDRLIGPQSNLLISNVPGPRERLYFHGAEMLAHYPVSQVGHGMALNITVISYAGGLYFGLVACPDAVPSVQRLTIHMEAAMQELEATFPAKPTARANRPPATRACNKISRPRQALGKAGIRR